MPKVLISDKMSPRAKEVFEEAGVEVDVITGKSEDELIEIIGDYDGLAIRSATKVTEKVLAAATNLKVIGRAGIGVDNVDIKAATNAGVVVMNTPFGNAITTAEHAIAMMMSLARNIPHANESTHQGLWEKSKFMGVEVTNKTLGIVGCGNIGSIVADRAQGLKMKVIAFDPFLTAERALEMGIKKVELDELFAKADFLSLHTPLTETTKGIIDAEAIAKMRDGVRIVNCARGGLVVEEDLRAALESGKVAGAAFDVFSEEPAKENVLFGAPNMVCTPHLGASTNEAQVNVAVQVAEQLSDYLQNGGVTNALNMPSLTAEEAPRLQPYMALAKNLGGFVGQLSKSGIKAIKIEYAGHVSKLNTKPLTAVLLQGLLSPLLTTVNMVNAPVLAADRDIDIIESTHSKPGDYPTLIRVTVVSENQERTVAGTLFANGRPRLVEVAGIALDSEFSEHMIYVMNDDKPGFIGALGSLLGYTGVNIATFALGRESVGERAVALIAIDQPMPKIVLDQVSALAHVRTAKALNF